MTSTRSKFAGGDQAYLRNEQYRDSERFARRGNLHAKYSVAPVRWFEWVVATFELFAGANVLEVGCGPGWLWEQTAASIPDGVHLALIDYSDGMVAEALQRVTSSGRLASVDGLQADAQDLPFADASFDRVVANHMLYHLPDPGRGVAELARVVRDDGIVIAATNGRRHMRELWEIRGNVFDLVAIDQTIDVFGADSGFAVMRDHFDDVQWLQFNDELRCHGPEALADVMAYVCSTPPAEDATVEQLAQIEAALVAAFATAYGTMTISKDSGCFVCRCPRRTSAPARRGGQRWLH